MAEKLSGMESLAIIEQMIQKAKNQFSEDGTLYLLWGWLVLFCSLGQFALDRLGYARPWNIWMLTWLMALYMIVFVQKRNRARKVKTYTEEMVGYVWLAFVIMMVLSFFLLGLYVEEYYRYNFLFVLLCYGMPTFLSGCILKFRPLVYGGIACWVLALLAGQVDFHYHPLFTALAVVLAWIIPGYSLRAKFNNQKH